MSNNLNVAVSADVADLTSKFAIAKASVSALSSELNNLARQSVSGVIDAAGTARMQQLAGDLVAAKNAAAGYREQISQAAGATRQFASPLDEIRSKFSTAFQATGIGLAIEGITKLGEAVDSLGERATQMRSYAEVLGVSVEQFQTMGLAAEEAGTSSEVLSLATANLVKQLDEARDGSGAAIEKLKSLGITTQQIANPAFGAAQILQTLHDRLINSGTAAQTFATLSEVLGARAKLAAAAIKQLDLSAQGVRKSMAEVNGLTGTETDRLADLYVFLGKVADGYKNTTSKALLFIQDVVTMGPAMAGAMATYNAAIAKTTTAQAAADAARSGQIQRGINDYQLQQAAAILSANAITAVDLASIKERISAEASGSASRLALVRQFYQESLQYYGSASVDKVREAHSELLAETREYNASQLRLDQELQSGETALQGQVQALVRQNIELHKQMTEEAKKDAEAQLDAQRESVVGQITLQKQLIQSTQGKAGTGVSEQATAAEIALSVQELEAWEKYYQAKAQLAGGDMELQDTIQKERLAKETAIDGQILTLTTKSANEMAQVWTNVSNKLSDALSQSLDGMLNHTKTFKESMVKMFDQYAEGAISNLIRVGVQQAVSAATSLTVQRTAQQQAVMVDAKSAAAGAYSSVAQIPYVGWILAPIAAAAAFAAVEGFSAESGFDIPSGLNPMTQLHAREMVLPSQYADVIRGLARNGGNTYNQTDQRSSTGSTNFSEEHNYHGGVNISAFDAQGVKRLFSQSATQRQLAGAARQYFRRGGR